MARHVTRVDPKGTGPLDHVEAYEDDGGKLHYPGDEGYVEPGGDPSGATSDNSATDPGAQVSWQQDYIGDQRQPTQTASATAQGIPQPLPPASPLDVADKADGADGDAGGDPTDAEYEEGGAG